VGGMVPAPNGNAINNDAGAEVTVGSNAKIEGNKVKVF